MGLFKKTPAFTSLLEQIGPLANAVGQVSIGSMPPDFVDAVAEGCSDQLQQLYREASQEVGAEKAMKEAQKHASYLAGIWGDTNANFVAKRNASIQAAAIVQELLDAQAS